MSPGQAGREGRPKILRESVKPALTCSSMKVDCTSPWITTHWPELLIWLYSPTREQDMQNQKPEIFRGEHQRLRDDS